MLRSPSRGMDLLILNTLSSIWRSLEGMRGRRARIREGSGNQWINKRKGVITW